MPFVNTIQRWGREEGLREGVIMSISPFLKAKFPEHWEQLVGEIAKLEDLTLLQSIPDAIQTAATPEEVRRAWSQ